jgi:hypothetical protein
LNGSGARSAVALASVAASGLPRNPQNAAAIRRALAANVPVEEKAMLTRLLANQFTPDDATGMNQLIASDLKNLTNSSDDTLARAALFAFTRLGYLAGFEDVLLLAKNRRVIDDDAYLGELSHVLPFASGADQERIARLLGDSNNGYAAQIAAMNVNNGWSLGVLSSGSKMSLTALLEKSEPAFSPALGQFDYVEATRYAEWLRALATLRASNFNRQGAELVMARLGDPTIDPRKIMAFLASEHGSWLITQIGAKDRFTALVQRISLYSRQHPQNADMRALVDQVSAVVSGLKG